MVTRGHVCGPSMRLLAESAFPARFPASLPANADFSEEAFLTRRIRPRRGEEFPSGGSLH
jgi:hypothetical protein